jgi:hypothetical protein
MVKDRLNTRFDVIYSYGKYNQLRALSGIEPVALEDPDQGILTRSLLVIFQQNEGGLGMGLMHP